MSHYYKVHKKKKNFFSIMLPLFITFGDKNYGNITVKKKSKTRHVYIQSKYVKLS